MISVLIPVYNYHIVDLVTNLHTQLELCNIPFEIICFDDHSSEVYSKKNQVVSALKHTTYTIHPINVGRIQARQHLAEQATYDWLLFLDADVLPKSQDYIQKYLNLTDANYDAIYGGFAYYDTAPEQDYRLRWTYGKTHEQVLAAKRNQKPYKVIISANFIIKKALFLALNSKIKHKGYGYDNFFGALLKMSKAKVFHIDNEVYHLGIETSETYLRKKEQAAETLLKLYKNDAIPNHQNDLLKLFIKLKRFRLTGLFSLLFKQFKPSLQNNLIGKTPSMLLLQLYRISYMCYKDLKK